MENVFRGFKEQIEKGVKNNIPRDARLIIIGQLMYASETGELTPNEAETLRNLLGNPIEFKEARAYAIFGELV